MPFCLHEDGVKRFQASIDSVVCIAGSLGFPSGSALRPSHDAIRRSRNDLSDVVAPRLTARTTAQDPLADASRKGICRGRWAGASTPLMQAHRLPLRERSDTGLAEDEEPRF